MVKRGLLEDKSFSAAVAIIKLGKRLISKSEYDLGRQILKSGTSVGANIREAKGAESDLDYIHKLAIAQKECEETLYWLELLKETGINTDEEFAHHYPFFDELMKIISYTIIKKKRG